MKFINLLTAAYAGGQLRHPHEGVLHVEDAEAEKLVTDGVATDVTDDFTAKQAKEAPVESNSAPGGMASPTPTENPHQSEVAPQATEDTKSRARKVANHKE